MHNRSIHLCTNKNTRVCVYIYIFTNLLIQVCKVSSHFGFHVLEFLRVNFLMKIIKQQEA